MKYRIIILFISIGAFSAKAQLSNNIELGHYYDLRTSTQGHNSYLGLLFSYQASENLVVYSGLRAIRSRTYFHEFGRLYYPGGPYFPDLKETHHYRSRIFSLGLPIGLQYDFFPQNNLSPYLALNSLGQYSISTKIRFNQQFHDLETNSLLMDNLIYNDREFRSHVWLEVSTSLGMQFQISDEMQLDLSSSFVITSYRIFYSESYARLNLKLSHTF